MKKKIGSEENINDGGAITRDCIIYICLYTIPTLDVYTIYIILYNELFVAYIL